MPASLRPFFAGLGRAQALDALFAAVSETLLEFHPHLHCLVTGGGLAADRWVHRRRYLLHLRNVRVVFRGKLLQKLGRLLRAGTVTVARSSAHDLLRDASQRSWNVYAKRPLASPAHVITYFARYTRSIALSNRCLVRYDGARVTFRWRDRAHGNRQRLATLDALTFCRRFLRHVLPARFVRIRRYGILSNRVRGPLLERCRTLIDDGATPPAPRVPESRREAVVRIFGFDTTLCPTCQKGRLVIRAQWGPTRTPLNTVLITACARAL